MKVTMFWYGGSTYGMFDVHSERDAEVFSSLRDAKRAFGSRTSDDYYQCVDDDTTEHGGPSAWLFLGAEHPVIGQEYPDLVMEFGPRGGVVVRSA